MARCLEATGLTGGVPLHRSPVGPAARGHSWARSSTTRWDGLFSPAKGHQSRQWVDRPPGCQAAGGGRQAPCPASRTLSLARHCTASSGDRRFRAPAICSLGGVEAGLGPERKWRRRQGAAGRPRVGRPARGPPREAAGGRPSCGVRVCACARVHTRSPACRAGRPGRVGRPRGPSGTWRGRGVERPARLRTERRVRVTVTTRPRFSRVETGPTAAVRRGKGQPVCKAGGFSALWPPGKTPEARALRGATCPSRPRFPIRKGRGQSPHRFPVELNG